MSQVDPNFDSIVNRYAFSLVLEPDRRGATMLALAREMHREMPGDGAAQWALILKIQTQLLATIDAMLEEHPNRDEYLQTASDLYAKAKRGRLRLVPKIDQGLARLRHRVRACAMDSQIAKFIHEARGSLEQATAAADEDDNAEGIRHLFYAIHALADAVESLASKAPQPRLVDRARHPQAQHHGMTDDEAIHIAVLHLQNGSTQSSPIDEHPAPPELHPTTPTIVDLQWTFFLGSGQDPDTKEQHYYLQRGPHGS